jgi:hypothetical protein
MVRFESERQLRGEKAEANERVRGECKIVCDMVA